MAGIWERIAKVDAVPGGDRLGRIGINQVEAALIQEGTGMYTGTQIKDKINLRLSKKGHDPLDAAEIADLVALAAVVAAISGTANKLVWLLKLRSLMTDAEMNLVDETEFRTQLGITL